MPVTLLNAGDITMSKNKSADTELLHNLDRGDKLRKLLSIYYLLQWKKQSRVRESGSQGRLDRGTRVMLFCIGTQGRPFYEDI